jgi:hypothetical protein
MPQTQPASLPKDTSVRQSLLPLVLLCWGVLAYTLVSSRLQPGQARPLPLISAWLQPALHIPRHSLCLFKDLTHLPCVFCGLTRSFVLIGHGQWRESLHYHLLGIPFYLLMVSIALLGVLVPQQAARLIRLLTRRHAVYLLIVILLLCWVWKLGQDPQFW